MQHTYLKIYLWKIFRMPCSSCMHEEENAIGPVTFDVMYITKKNAVLEAESLSLFHLTIRQMSMENVFISHCFTQLCVLVRILTTVFNRGNETGDFHVLSNTL